MAHRDHQQRSGRVLFAMSRQAGGVRSGLNSAERMLPSLRLSLGDDWLRVDDSKRASRLPRSPDLADAGAG